MRVCICTFVPSHTPAYTGGKLPLGIFASLVQGNANMQGCGPITLPSGAELDGAPQKIKDRINAHIRSDWLNAIRSIDEGDKEGVVKVEGESIDIRLGHFKHLCTIRPRT